MANALPRDEAPRGYKYLYVITRIDTGLKYVGCTKQELSKRLAEHAAQGTLGGASKELLSMRLLEVVPDNDGRVLEANWIRELDTCDPLKGYNRRRGNFAYPCNRIDSTTKGKRRPRYPRSHLPDNCRLSKVINIRLSLEEYQRVQFVAQQTGRTMSEMVRVIVQHGLDDMERLLGLAA